MYNQLLGDGKPAKAQPSQSPAKKRQYEVNLLEPYQMPSDLANPNITTLPRKQDSMQLTDASPSPFKMISAFQSIPNEELNIKL